MHKYRIKNHSEEHECEECGFPLYQGDIAVQSRLGGIYCSEFCHKPGLQREKDHAEWVEKVYRQNMSGL